MPPRILPLFVWLVLCAAGCGDRVAQERASAAAVHGANAEAALKEGDFARALAAADLAVAYDPMDPRNRDRLVRVRLSAVATVPDSVQIDNVPELVYQADTQLKRDPANGYIYKVARGYLALARNEGEAVAEKLFSEAVAQKSDWAAAHLAMARLAARRENRREAIASAEAALKINPRNAAALAFLGRLLVDQKDFDGAIENLKLASELGDSAAIRLDWARALFAKNRHTEAGELLQKAVALEPRNGEAHRRLGEWFFAGGQDELAQREFMAASQLGAEPLATYGLGMVLQRKEDFVQAAKHFELAWSANPRFAAAAFQAGLSYEMAGSAAAAKTFYERYLEAAAQSPDEAERSTDVRARLARLSPPGRARAAPSVSPAPPRPAGR